MVAGGTAPLLFIWDLAAAELLYALHLPIAHSVYGTAQLHFMPDSQTVAGMLWRGCSDALCKPALSVCESHLRGERQCSDIACASHVLLIKYSLCDNCQPLAQ